MGSGHDLGKNCCLWQAEPQPAGTSDDFVPLKGLGPAPADILRSLVVVVIGLGAVGARLFVQLARLGIGTLVGIDPDDYGPESWQTQPARRWTDAGASKARRQGEIAHDANPGTTVLTFHAFAQDVPLWVFRAADVVVAAGDNLELMVWAGVSAAALGKPLLQGAVFGEQWLALVRKYPLEHPAAACPACALGTREWSLLRERHGCDPQTARVQGIEPTRTLPPVCSLAASLLAGELLRAVLPAASQGTDAEELDYCLLTHRIWQTKYARNWQCRCPHERWRQIDVAGPPSETTLEMLLMDATYDIKPRPLVAPNGPTSLVSPTVQIRGETPFASFTICSHCGMEVAVRRFAKVGDSVGQCGCGETLRAIPMATRSVIPSHEIRHCLGIPLSELGVPAGGAIGVATEDLSTYYFIGQPPLVCDFRKSRPLPVKPAGVV